MRTDACRRVMTMLFVFLTVAGSVSCARALLVSVEPRSPDGIPIRLPVPVKVLVTRQYANPATCPETQVERVMVLPLGERVYVNARSWWLTKSEFSVEFHENGVLKGVGRSSDPSSAISAAKDVLTAALPYALATEERTKSDRAEDCVVIKESYGEFRILSIRQ